MKRSILAVAMAVGCVAAVLRAQTNTLTSLNEIHGLTNAQASRHIPVKFEATVTYYRDYERTMFVQDGDTAIYVLATSGLKLMPGDRVMVRGTTESSFRPIIVSGSIERLGHDSMPKAVAANLDDLMKSRYDCRLVTVRALVRSADVANYALRNSRMQVLVEGADVDVTLDDNDTDAMRKMLDAEVELTGVDSGRFDGKMQLTGVMLHVASLANIQVLTRAPASPWSLPVTEMDEILKSYHVVNRTERVRVQGTITYYQPGSTVVLQNGTKSLWIMTKTRNELRIGDNADATGIPDVHDGFLVLNHGELRDSGIQSPVPPRESTWAELTQSRRLFDLVSTRGRVVMAVREAGQDEYQLLADGQHTFSAIIRHPTSLYGSTAPPPLPPMKAISIGSTVQVTGICVLENSNPFDANVPFNLVMRSYDDIAVIARPSWMTVRNLVLVISAMVVLILGVTAWGWTLRRKVLRQTVVLAARAANEAETERRNARLQQQRSRILEDINGSRPLVDVLREITELVSFQLNGAACWCEIADGARVGRYATDSPGTRLVQEPIPARSGPSLGTVFAAIYPHTPDAALKEAFFVGSQLASLAIENRRLYTDLVHRSEFDLLTDIHNRFSLDKELDAAIARAREDARIFGLIYVDLDEFKQVNDVYGHRVGDLYLQEVAGRMKRQLRGADLLARVGGDEFVVLVPKVHSRADLEEIASRLESCFDAPFQAEGYVLNGSASVGIALYPEDGSTKDSLLSAADAAMYVAKHVKHDEAETGNANTDPLVPRKRESRS
jgi:diguanylate cyclase (GGDEF)-like protein